MNMQLVAITNIAVGWDRVDYDADGDEKISKSEAIQAIQDYFDGKISKAQAIDVVMLYFG